MPLSSPQQQIVEAPQRFKVVIAGRRFGKTHLAIRQLCFYARLPEQNIWYVAPTYRQAKMITWKKLRKKLVELRWAKKINETELSIELKNGSVIALKGADNYDSLRGIGLDYLVLDEFADIDPEAWFETLRPTLADRQGGALFIGTPKGLNWAKELYDMADEYSDEWASFQFTTIQGGNVKPEEVEAARRTLDLRTFRQEFEATFETFSGRVFYAFDRKYNLKPYLTEANQTLPELHIGMDFNIDPMSAVIAVKIKDTLHVIDEVRMMGSNTEELVQEIQHRYPKHKITVYPDPAGSQRKTSAGGRTDHTILRLAGFTVRSPAGHNAIRDGVNAVNAKLRSSSGITTLFFDPKCKYSIECLEKQVYKEGTSIPDKDSGFDHMNDALRYMVDYLFPIRQPVQAPSTRMWSHKLG
jgi:hypothetical protein